MDKNMNLILASKSPRREQILKEMGFEFKIIPSTFDECLSSDKFSYAVIENLAVSKAKSVLEMNNGDIFVLGADTVVVCDEKILGKPKDKLDAIRMLKMLSGKTHFVVTSVALVSKEFCQVESETTYVTFNSLTNEQIEFYIDNYFPYDKAGSYGIQELPEGFVKSLDGERDNVIGLPSKLVYRLLKLF